MWETVELRELRVFLTLAEELHFARTAERLQLTPSRVSQSVRGLEQKLGAQLAHRTSRRVQLTSFGRQVVSELGPAYAQLTGALERLGRTARSVEGTIRLGVFSGPAGGPRLLEVLSAFRALHPECEVEIVQLRWDDPLDQLRTGEVDLMVSWLPLDQPDLVIGPTVSRGSRALAVAPDHPLAARDHVTVEDLADFRVPRFDGWPRELHEAWIPATTPSGRSIPYARIPAGERGPLEIATRVAQGELVHLTATSAAPYLGPFELRFVPIKGLPPFRSALIWRRGSNEARVREFIRVARQVLTRRAQRTQPDSRRAEAPSPLW
jgi:DNA-binding transcriptional LysR family regulator